TSYLIVQFFRLLQPIKPTGRPILPNRCWHLSAIEDTNIVKTCKLYSVAYTVIWIIQFLDLQRSTGGFDKVSSSVVYGVYTSYFIDIIALGLLFITSAILLIGVFKNSKCLLIPYMVAITALIVFQAIAWFLHLFNWYKINESLTTTLIISLIAWILLAFVNVICLLCVISEYQKLSKDRGQKNDAEIAYTPTCPHVITSPPETQVASYPIENL
ncbi:uncharacterized protein LOC121407078, partial [Lytechinus variegatus]|uniref:uncharacterized protein LOC121407078 n=1 Tax=Lytechinus variegatus TaxID=7654 RepID=UPI001BB102F5